jgi:choline/ethanolamine kinase
MKLFLIDYDYCRYNFRSYDIANFFNEFNFDYSLEEEPYFTHKNISKNMVLARNKFMKYYLTFASIDSKKMAKITTFNDIKKAY